MTQGQHHVAAAMPADRKQVRAVAAVVAEDDPDYFRRFPVFVIGFALAWLGLLAPLDHWFSALLALPGALVQPAIALIFVCLGLALLLARSHADLAAALALAAACMGLAAPWLGLPVLESMQPAHELGQYAPLLFALLALAVYGSMKAPLARLFARSACMLASVLALAYALVVAWSPSTKLVDHPADVLYIMLALLCSAAVVSLSRRHTPERFYSQRAPFICAMMGTFLAAVCWYALTQEERYFALEGLRAGLVGPTPLQILARLFPALLFLAGLLFSVLISRSVKLSTVLRTHARQLEYNALHDPLTGLPNKVNLARTLPTFLGSAHQYVWVMAVDLGGLKLINDSAGHPTGDRVLALAAQRIAEHANQAALVARLEGDEFVLVLLDLNEKQVTQLAQTVMSAVAQPYAIDGMQLRLTASVGITVANHTVPEPMELVREAELAMTWAQRDGSNTFHTYSPDLSIPVQERLTLRTELQNALDQQQFVLYYQPILDARMGTIVGAEALLRWPHPTRGLVSPRHFIALAEETGLIVPLSNWVIDTAASDIMRLRHLNHADFPVVVNVSPLHFRRSDFVDVLQKAIAKYQLPEGSLDLEITENMIIEHTEDTFAKLREVRRLGVRVSIDDFGTGYSNLNYLKRLPVDKIKIDQCFVQDVISDKRDAAITKSIIGLAHHLNLKVVAEGVETEAQYWFLKRNFCDEIQGYLFQRPVSFDDFSQLLFEQGGRINLPAARVTRDSDKVLLLLDDEPNILRALTRLLRRDGYRILTADTPQEAFSLLAQNDVQVVMSDQRMPEMTGTEFFSRVKEMYPETIRLILSGYTDLKSVTDAINHGAIYRFLTKPWDDEELRREISEAFKGYQSQDSRVSSD